MLLAKDGIDQDSKGNEGRTPLMIAAYKGARGGGESATGEGRR